VFVKLKLQSKCVFDNISTDCQQSINIAPRITIHFDSYLFFVIVTMVPTWRWNLTLNRTGVWWWVPNWPGAPYIVTCQQFNWKLETDVLWQKWASKWVPTPKQTYLVPIILIFITLCSLLDLFRFVSLFALADEILFCCWYHGPVVGLAIRVYYS
jgi:hypothetical protein